MKSIVVFTTWAVSFFLFAGVSAAQERGNNSSRISPNASVGQTIGTTTVNITYGRPSVNGRTIFGDLVPLNEVWRTGANEATVITFSDQVLIEGEAVEAGTYALFTLPGEEAWIVILNGHIAWGTQYDETADVIRVQAAAESAHFKEQMSIYFENVSETEAQLVVHWDETRVPVQIETAAVK